MAAGCKYSPLPLPRTLIRGKAGNTSSRFGEAAARVGAADRAATMVHMALDTETRWQLAETAVHGNAAGAACQYQRSKHVVQL